MEEVAEIRDIAKPHETLLVADSLTGQDAVNIARKAFNERVGITGIVLTRVDGDGRGGAALSMRAVTGKPIKLIGVGEKWDALEDFHPQRDRRPHPRHGRRRQPRREGGADHRRREGAGDRAEDAQGRVRPRGSRRAAQADAADGRHGRRDGHAARRRQDEAADGGRRHGRQGDQAPGRHHLVDDAERAPQPEGARRQAQAAHRGRFRHDGPTTINRLLKMHRQMADMMKMMGKNKGMMQRMAGAFGMGGGGGGPSGAEIERMQAELARLDPKALEQLPKEVREQLGAGGGKGAAPSLPGLGARPCRACPVFRDLVARHRGCRAFRASRARRSSAMIPTLETERLRLRPWRDDDLDAFAVFTADRKATEFVGGTFSRGDTWRRIAMFLGHWQLRGYGNWVIEEKASGAFVGYSGLWKPDGWPEPEIMWGLLPAASRSRLRDRSRRRARAPTPIDELRLADGRQLHRRRQICRPGASRAPRRHARRQPPS